MMMSRARVGKSQMTNVTSKFDGDGDAEMSSAMCSGHRHLGLACGSRDRAFNAITNVDFIL